MVRSPSIAGMMSKLRNAGCSDTLASMVPICGSAKSITMFRETLSICTSRCSGSLTSGGPLNVNPVVNCLDRGRGRVGGLGVVTETGERTSFPGTGVVRVLV